MHAVRQTRTDQLNRTGRRADDLKPKKRILILTNFPLPESGFQGGVETATAGLLDGLRSHQSEFDIHVLSTTAALGRDLEVSRDGFCFHYVAPPLGGVLRPRTLFAALRSIQRIASIRPDLLHVQGNVQLGLAALMCRIPKVFAIHGIPSKELAVWRGPGVAGIAMESLCALLIRKFFSHFISVSPELPIQLAKQKKWVYIPNAVRPQFFTGVEKAPLGRKIVLFVGGLTRMKGMDILLEAFLTVQLEFPDVELVLMGDTQGQSISIAETATGRVRRLGVQDVNSVKRVMGESLLLVLPSLQENSPMVIAEAMAMGLPIVASNVGGIPRMVEDGRTGFLVDPGSTTALIAALREALSDRRRLSALGEMGRKKALKEYSPESVAYQTALLYRSILGT